MSTSSLPMGSAQAHEDPGEAQAELEAAGPVRGTDRVDAVDILRGLAVLGILAMNIYAFAMPFPAYNNPLLHGGDSGANLWVWFFNHLVFDQKFLPIFSMLFGAGLALMYDKAKSQGRSIREVYYRRNLWLILFGMFHAYLIWFGDILFFYAVCGLLLYFFRNLSPRKLLVVGPLIFMVGVPLNYFSGSYFQQVQQEVNAAKAGPESDLSAEDKKKIEEWDKMSQMMFPTQEHVDKQLTLFQEGSYREIFTERIKFVVGFQIGGIFMFALWRCGGLMLIGMALLRLGVFSGARSRSFYWRMLAVGYGIGVPMVAWGAYLISENSWNGLYLMQYGLSWNYVGSLAVSLGHVSVLMLVIKSGALAGLTERLRWVGRMAFTNYLMQSVVMTTIFYSYGLGLFGTVDRLGQMGFVVAMWIAQLLWSPWWLERFRFGPAEWLWRSLTYWQRQPFRR